MGDRANIAVQVRGERVYLYTHWNGYDLPETVRRALARKQRWDDAPYLTRIIFCEMVRGEETEESGFGISTQLGDNSYPLIVVDVAAQTVSCEAALHGAVRGGARVWAIKDYAALPAADWSSLDSGVKTDG